LPSAKKILVTASKCFASTRRLTYPSGGPESCIFDRSCADLNSDDRLDLGRKQSNEVYHPVYDIVRLNGAVRSALSLCYPRGAAVDEWRGRGFLSASNVPRHPRACADGWYGSSMRGFCCPLEGAGSAGNGIPSWAGGGSACDCVPQSIGPNPGGAGGGRVRVTAGIEVCANPRAWRRMPCTTVSPAMSKTFASQPWDPVNSQTWTPTLNPQP